MPESVLSASPSAGTGAASGLAHASRLDVAADLLVLLHDTATEPRPDTQLEALTLAVAADLPVLLWDEPGIGKAAALTQLATALDLPLITVIASVHEPSDFSGLLFPDELSTAPPAVQAALLRISSIRARWRSPNTLCRNCVTKTK